MPYGTIKVDNITFTDNSVDKTVSLSGLIQNPTFTGNVTVTGTISGDVIRGGTTISGVTVTGTTANFVSGVFTTQVSGATIIATTGTFTSLTGTTTTGTTANFVSGVFTTQLSGATITGTTVSTTTGSFVSLTGTTATFTSGIIASGTAALPSLAILSDPNTGLFSPGADQVAISTNGTSRIVVDASGNVNIDSNTFYVDAANNYVGIGNTSPASELDVKGEIRIYPASGNATVRFGIGGVEKGKIAVDSSSNLLIETAGTERARIRGDGTFEIKGAGTAGVSPAVSVNPSAPTNSLFISSGGLVGLGTSGPTQKLHIVDTSAGAAVDCLFLNNSSISANTSVGISFGPNTSNAIIRSAIIRGINESGGSGNATGLQFLTNPNGGDPTEKVRITSAGLVGIGTTSPGRTLDVVGTAKFSNGTADVTIYGDVTTFGALGTNSNFPLALYTNGTEKVRIDTSGRLLVGTSTSRGVNGLQHVIQIEGTTLANSSESIVYNGNDANPPYLTFAKSRGTSLGSVTAVTSDTGLGGIAFMGADGTSMLEGATIKCFVDGTPGTNDLPTRLVFSTTADGAASPTERMRINSSGGFKASNAGAYTGATAAYHEFYQTNNVIGLFIRGTNASQTSSILEINGDRTTTNASYNLIDAYNGNVSGRFSVRDSGNAVNTNNSYGAISDAKLKENIIAATSQWSDIKALQVRKYNFKEGQTHTQIGLVAQEAELVSPGLVGESPDRDAEGNDLGTVTKSVNYSVLYMKAVKALQEAMERIETLEASNADILARLSALEGK